MPRKTLALITGLVVVTVILFVVALRAGQQQNAPSTPQPTGVAQQPEPTIPAFTVLALSPNPVTVAPGQQGTAQVTIDTSENDVTAVQLELGYDPNVLTNVKVLPGTLIANPAVLIDKNDPAAGRYTYAFGITPNGTPVKGTGVVATVTFTVKAGTAGQQSQLGLLPTTLVTARGVAESVMKSGTGTIITVSGTGATAPSTATSGAGQRQASPVVGQ
ncbi:MAG: hypothetical protein H0W89_00945 [Candidatus Levybacteria bacterium]|nr:hypothetical protein [Candidatus Levybacteria bacterium]